MKKKNSFLQFSNLTRRAIALMIMVTIVAIALLTAPTPAFAQSTHTVAPGQTLYAISRLYAVPVADLIAANSLINPNFLQVGQVLTIPGTDSGGGGEETPANPPPVTETRTHVVSSGQTVGTIAQLYGVTINDIAAANQLLNINLIYVGQVLNIPGSGGGTPSTPAPAPTPAPEAPPPSSTKTHVVSPGQTLGGIAALYGVTVQSIVSANGLFSANLIYVGQVLTIPGATSGGGGTTPQPAPPPSEGPITINGTALGGQTHNLSHPNEMKDAGMTWVKFQHKWGQGNNAADLQGRITNGHNNGFKVLLSIPGADTYPSSIDFNGYVEFLRGVAGLSDPPDAIEVWNEMNIDFEWPAGQISPETYVNSMLAPAYNAIKGANSNVMVISGAPAPTGFFGGGCAANGCDDDAYIRRMAAAGATRYMDCMGVHYNAGATAPSASSGHPADNGARHYSWYYGPMVNTYSAALGRNTPLCFTEVGYLSTNGYPATPPAFSWAGGTTVDQHAQWLADAYRSAANDSRVQMFIVFNVDLTFFDPNGDPQAGYAIIRPDGSCPACGTLKAVSGG